MNSDVIILCGGLGTRLRSVISDIPKPMADVNGKPFLSYLLDQLSIFGAKRVILSVGYKYEAIQYYVGSTYKNIDIIYAVENSPLGTGGGLKYACNFAKSEYICVLNGDSFINVDLNEFEEFAKKQSLLGSQISIVLKEMENFNRYGTVTFSTPWILGFREKQEMKSGFINTGVYMLNPSIFEHTLDTPFSFEKEVLEKYSANNNYISGFLSDGEFIDIGIPEDYNKAQKMFPFKQSPTVSIITVCFNAQELIEKTFRSICNQLYENIEYIIVDGNSKDNTLNILNNLRAEYPKRKITIVSQADKGIYDAMNKGIKLATGDFLWFINAGDCIYSEQTLSDIFTQLKITSSLTKIIYGETMLINQKGDIIGMREHRAPKKLNWRSFQRGMLVCHQSILVSNTIAGEYLWTKYGGSSDIDWVIRALKQCSAKDIFNSNSVLSLFLVGGYSAKNEKRSWGERYRIMIKHYGFLRTWFWHLYIIGRRVYRKIRCCLIS